MNGFASCCLSLSLVVVLCVSPGDARGGARMPDDVAHRMSVRRGISNPETRARAAEAALEDTDPAVRRHALLTCARLAEQTKDTARYEALAKRFLTDADVSVRLLAKAMSRRQVPYRDNQPFSQSPHRDYAEKRLQSVAVRDGAFELVQPVPRHEGIELRFGKPARDLYVWLNGVYLGQFDSDLDRGREFRLDATQETKLTGENTVVVRDAAGKETEVGITAEVLSWRF